MVIADIINQTDHVQELLAQAVLDKLIQVASTLDSDKQPIQQCSLIDLDRNQVSFKEGSQISLVDQHVVRKVMVDHTNHLDQSGLVSKQEMDCLLLRLLNFHFYLKIVEQQQVD